jgi:hypothetical protein
MRALPLVALTLLSLLTACSRNRVRVDRLVTPPRLRRAQSSYKDALEQLGPPADIRPLERGFAFVYSALDFKEWRLRFDYQRLAASYATGERRARGLLLLFDEAGALREQRATDDALALGWGSVIGHSYVEEPFYGRQSYDRLAGLHRWSGGQLRSSARPLSRHQDPDPNTRPKDPESDEQSDEAE